MFVNKNNTINVRKACHLLLTFGILALLSLPLIPQLLPESSFADEPITVNPSITIGNSGILSLEVNPGQFGSSTESVVVTTSNYTGYSMTIAPSSGNNTDLEHTNVANVTLPSISPTAPDTSITRSAFENLSSAAYGLSIDDGANYLPVVSGSTIKTTNTATNATTGAFNLTLGAKTLSSTPAGSYTKTFLLTATTNDAAYNITYDKNLGGDTDTTGNFPSTNEATVSGTVLTLSAKTPTRTGYEFLHWNTADDDSDTSYNVQGTINLESTADNPITLYAIWGCGDGFICYYDNGADGGQGTMLHANFQTSVYSGGSSQRLVAPNYSKTGYGFIGWSETQVDLTQSDTNLKAEIANLASQGKIYGPNQTITMPSSGPLELYAVWQPAEKDGNDDPVYLQGWNGCSSLDPNEVIVLTDSRDNEVYAIARIVDNVSNPTYSQCWMIENLRLDVTDSNITYTNNNTNHPASSFLYQIDAFTSGDPTWKTCQSDSIACDDQISYSLANINRANTASYNAANQTSSWYSYGGMYNWFTATAGNGLYGIGTENVNTAGDICPTGWHLPTTTPDATTDYKTLNVAVNANSTNTDTGLRTYPANFVYSGDYYGSNKTDRRGSSGFYGSSTVQDNSRSRDLSFASSYVISLGNIKKYYGITIRCLAGNPNYYIVYDANGGTGYGDPQSLGTTVPDGTTTTTLTASNFSRTGYGFAGWSRNPNADPNGANATTEIFGPNAQYTVPAASNFDSNKNLTLYAIWVPLAKDSNNNDLTFQTANLLTTTLSDNSTLDSKSNGYVTALKDTRDNEVYAVAKLADGNYWMIENMRLDLSSNNTTITTSNTNHPTQAFVTDINTNYKGKADDPNTTLWKTCQDNTPACNDQVSFVLNNLNRTSVTPITTSPKYEYQNYGWYSHGIYYNWYTATGGTGTYSKSSGVTDGDLCPAGWHLPQGGSGTGTRGGNTTGGFYYLARLINGNTTFNNTTTSANIRKYPNNFLYSGYYNGSSPNSRGYNGSYWSSTASNNNAGYYLSLYTSYIYPGTVGNDKYRGQFVRCVVNAMESFTLTYDANGGTGAPATDPGGSSNTRSYDFAISSTTPTRSGLTFAGWSTDQNATEESTLYQAGSTFTAYQPSTTLYAVWVPEVIIHFNGSGGTGSMADQGVPSGTSRTLRPNAFSKSGLGFSGWATVQGSTTVEYLDEASYTAPVVAGPDPLEITLYAVWGRSRSIVYDINTDDVNANGVMDAQSVYEYSQSALWASNFARPNYGFAGWSTDSDAYTHMTDNDGTNDPTIYGPNETITVPSYGEGSSSLTLYAVWVPAESGVTMQTFNPNDSTYSGKAIGTVIALNDNRDTTNVYAVAKLADGNWWMIENLRFDPAGKTLNSTNTNNPNSSFASSVSNLQSSSFATCTVSSSACFNQYSVGLGNLTGSTNGRTSNSQSYRWYSYGAMYNWYTATAGHGTYNKSSGVTDGDICPAGWHLPYGGDDASTKGGNTSGGFYYLNYKLNNDSNATDATASNNLRAYPNNFLYSGAYGGSSARERGSSGSYWSSTASDNNNGYYLYFYSSYVNPGPDPYEKYRGFAVRCVASPRQTLTLSFDATKVASIEIDGTSYNNGDTVSLIEGSTHTINMTFQSGYEFDSWGITGTGSSVASASTNPTTLTMGTTSAALTATAKVPTATCTKRYALQNADGTYPAYTEDATEQVAIGATCSYSKTVTDYQTQSTSGTMTANGLTLDLQLPRNTYTLTVNRNTTWISSVTGAGTKRWGETVSISATPITNATFSGWSQTAGTTGSFANASNASTTFTMPKSNATIYANGKMYMQNFTKSQCQSLAGSSDITVYDRRDGSDYAVRYLNSQCWMTQNLRITGTISATDSNFSSPSTFNISQHQFTDSTYCTMGSSSSDPKGYTNVCYKTGTDNNGNPTAWYNYAAATAGKIVGWENSSNATNDICPSGWRLPTGNEQSSLVTSLGSNYAPFHIAYGGVYNSLNDPPTLTAPNAVGRWWSSTADSSDPYFVNIARNTIYINGSSLTFASADRSYGFYIRCVRNS